LKQVNHLPELRPADDFVLKASTDDLQATKPLLLLACGALAREIVDVITINGWQHIEVQCFPAKWHNTPHLIVPAIRERLRDVKDGYQKVFVLYGDCGTGGQLDAMLNEEGVERIGGPHCYSFFSGNADFAAMQDKEFTAFYLTDYLARQFDKLIWEGLGLDKHPELLSDYFQHYTKVVYLAQVKDPVLEAKAEAAAKKLGLAYEYRFTGYGELATEVAKFSTT
jgi:Protein of unknown function (DUF1638)